MFSAPSYPGENWGERLGEPEFSQTLPRFATGYGGTDNKFYFFYKIIIFNLFKEKDDIWSTYCKFPKLGDSQP